MNSAPAPQAHIIVISGPSGSGKSRLARQLSRELGWPFVNLDDFYRDHDEPNLPHLTTGEIDWDHAGTWNKDAAVEALKSLCELGRAQVPRYSIATSRREGEREIVLGQARFVVTEGIFAPHVIGDLLDRGLLEQAWCLRRNRYVTAARRLIRDLAERRKPPSVLLRRGWRLCRDEPRLVAAHLALGAEPVSMGEALRRARALEAQGLEPAPDAAAQTAKVRRKTPFTRHTEEAR